MQFQKNPPPRRPEPPESGTAYQVTKNYNYSRTMWTARGCDFCFFCPDDAVMLTTNLKDHKPLAEGIGKQAEAL
jgi:hypothetical protein